MSWKQDSRHLDELDQGICALCQVESLEGSRLVGNNTRSLGPILQCFCIQRILCCLESVSMSAYRVGENGDALTRPGQ